MQVLPPKDGVFFGSMLRSVFLSLRRTDQSSSARRVDYRYTMECTKKPYREPLIALVEVLLP